MSATLSDATPLASTSPHVDIAILGAGPAGCSAASWLSQLGLKVALIEQAAQLCHSLQALQFKQDWLLGSPGQTLAELGQHYAAQTLALPGLQLQLGQRLTQLDWQGGGGRAPQP